MNYLKDHLYPLMIIFVLIGIYAKIDNINEHVEIMSDVLNHSTHFVFNQEEDN